MATIVVFSDQGARVYEGADPGNYKGRKDFLVNPVFPRGIPPHEWKMHPDGYIVGTPPVPKKRDLTVLKYIATGLLGVLIGYLIHRG